ncbi:hypothetical protein E4P41_05740 [Geodermatophilus sp. DF01-2]|nr:hypothetical protein E4P41_05740 [Geodermatophilus sp. DF01_2]
MGTGGLPDEQKDPVLPTPRTLGAGPGTGPRRSSGRGRPGTGPRLSARRGRLLAAVSAGRPTTSPLSSSAGRPPAGHRAGRG